MRLIDRDHGQGLIGNIGEHGGSERVCSGRRPNLHGNADCVSRIETGEVKHGAWRPEDRADATGASFIVVALRKGTRIEKRTAALNTHLALR